MKHFVTVTASSRPEFLLATLISLENADRPDVSYRIRLDQSAHPETVRVAYQFSHEIGTRAEVRHSAPYNPVINGTVRSASSNVLHAIHESLESDAEYLHLLDDDNPVNIGYWDFHESAHALKPDAWNVTACSLSDNPITPELCERVLLSDKAQTVGSSYRRKVLEKICEYVPLSYLDDPVGHIGRTFPDHPNPPWDHWEIDGALGRTCTAIGMTGLAPYIGRSNHIGYIGAKCWGGCVTQVVKGYPHRHGRELEGTTEQRARRLLEMTADEINALAEIPDHIIYDLDAFYGPVTEIVNEFQ